MKRLLLMLTLAAATLAGARAQYLGQPMNIHLTTGDDLTAEFTLQHITFSVEGNEIVWNIGGFPVKNVESVFLPSGEESMAQVRQALIDFYNATDGPNWKNNTNWCSDKPIDEWYGIETRGYPYVYYLMLHNNNIKGEFPQKGFLTKIGPCRYVSLGPNQLSGQIPKEIVGNLSIEDLHIHQNNLTGSLPAEIFKLPRLISFSAGENQLTGTIPEGAAYLMENNQLDLSGNDFSGDLPADIVNHPKFHLNWYAIVPQSGHLNQPIIPGYRLLVTDTSGNQLSTMDVYKNNIYTLIFDYSSAKETFTSKLKLAYKEYKQKGFEVLGMCPGDQEQVNVFLHENDIDWLNLDPVSFRDSIGSYFHSFNFINLVDNNGNVVFTSIMDDDGKMEDTNGKSTRDQKVFDVLAEKFGSADFTPYASTDYSRDGEVMTLQKATVGKGVDIVFLGNCFVDKDMEPGGKYEEKMKQAMEQFFAYEPYTSLRNRFNVYAVKAVSRNAEMYVGTKHAIETDADAFAYAQKITTLIPDRPMRVNIIYNALNAGRSITFMYDDNSYSAFMYTGINRVLNHEGGGHGIGRLYDEYVEDAVSAATQEVKDYYEKMWKDYGRGANIDMNSDVTKTRWARFAADSRYAGEGLDAYEGSGTVAYGVYRPTQNSMMRFNDMPFNAPSREAIYKYVMQESEGPDWKYDYETFVNFDAKGRAQFAEAVASQAPLKRFDDTDKQAAPTKTDATDWKFESAPPVIIQGTWQDALKNPTKISYQQ